MKGEGSENTYDLINEKKQKKKGSKYTNSGTLRLHAFRMESIPTFLDFIRGGLQVPLQKGPVIFSESDRNNVQHTEASSFRPRKTSILKCFFLNTISNLNSRYVDQGTFIIFSANLLGSFSYTPEIRPLS
jgi:hypothetical protein